jgi:hypothetical protein
VGVAAAASAARRSLIELARHPNTERNDMNPNIDIDLLDLETIESNLSHEEVKELDDESLHASASAFMVT